MLQFDVCCKAIDQNFDCGCDRCIILRLDSLVISPRNSTSFTRPLLAGRRARVGHETTLSYDTGNENVSFVHHAYKAKHWRFMSAVLLHWAHEIVCCSVFAF